MVRPHREEGLSEAEKGWNGQEAKCGSQRYK